MLCDIMWRDIVGCASCKCSCSKQDHECPVTVITYNCVTVQGTTSFVCGSYVYNTLAGHHVRIAGETGY